MTSDFYYDVAGISSLANSIQAEISKYSLTIENLEREFDNIKDYWKGPDCDKYLSDVSAYMKKLQLLKLTLGDYYDLLSSLATKLDGHSNF